ncbi:MAG: protein kinase [Cyanobacteria bacterium P01_D01_bin.44]
MAAKGTGLSDIFPDERLASRYKIIKQLSSGGFSQTFLAEDEHLTTGSLTTEPLTTRPLCVVKQLKSQSENSYALELARRLFQTEARVLQRLGKHSQIPYLLDYFEANREFYLILELIEGRSIAEELAGQQRWSEASVINLLQDILRVLTFVHQQNVIHRDIKPSNLIRRAHDGKIVLIDFGAVKQTTAQPFDTADNPTLTITIGTQGYMPNEQIAGQPRFSSDLYAVGMIGIQALTGIKPRNLKHDMQTGEVSWHPDVPDVSPKLAEVLDTMVRYHFKDRYQTAEAALQALEALLEDSKFDSSADASSDETQILPKSLELWQSSPQPTSASPPAEALAPSVEPTTNLPNETSPTPDNAITLPPEIVASPVPDSATDAVTDIVDSPLIGAAPIEAVEATPAEAAPKIEPGTIRGPHPGGTPDPAMPEPASKRRLRTDTSALARIALGASLALGRSLSSGKSHLRWYLLGCGLLAIAGVSILPTVADAVFQGLGLYATPDTVVCKLPAIPTLPTHPPDYEYIDGTQYYGSLEDGRPADGQVITLFPNGNRYDGEFTDGQRNGCGTFTFKNGRRYVGQFKQDTFHGQGIWDLENSDRYIGGMKNGKCSGLGTYTFADGTRQRGFWWNGTLLGSRLSCDR